MSLGIYPICLALFVFGDVKPQRIDVVGGMDTTTGTSFYINFYFTLLSNEEKFRHG